MQTETAKFDSHSPHTPGVEQLLFFIYCFQICTHLNIMLNSLRASSVTPVVFLWRN